MVSQLLRKSSYTKESKKNILEETLNLYAWGRIEPTFHMISTETLFLFRFVSPDESDRTLSETLSQMDSPSSAAVRGEVEGGGGEETPDSPARLAELRKKVLTCMLEQLYLVEVAGGMRSICFMKVSTSGSSFSPLYA